MNYKAVVIKVRKKFGEQKTPKLRTRVHLTFEEYQELRSVFHGVEAHLSLTRGVNAQAVRERCEMARAMLEDARWRTHEEQDS